MDRRMDCGGVLLPVDGRCLPSAAASSARTPASAITGGVGEISGAAGPGTTAYCDTSQSRGAVEHMCANRKRAGSASVQSEAKISEIGWINPPVQLARICRDLQSVGTRCDTSDLHQFPRVDILTSAGR